MNKEEYEKRKKELENEIAQLNAIQLSLKIMMNSEYGALANENFIFYDSRNAEAITSVGQVANKFIARKLNEYMTKIVGVEEDYVIAMDTDSDYVNFGPFVNKYLKNETDIHKIADVLDKVSREKIEPFINKSYKELSDYLNAYAQEWKMKREVISSGAVFVAKKRYFMNIINKEGVRLDKPKLKIIGLEAKKSSTPELCRDALKKAYKIILEEGEDSAQKFIIDFKKEFFRAHVLDIASPRSVNNIEKYTTGKTFKKGTPIAVKGAIIFNNAMQEIDPLYETIKSGDKIKYIPLIVPNRFRCDVISLPNALPKSLDLRSEIIDKNSQFHKTFEVPLCAILNLVGWSPEKKKSLLGFL